ncbi:MAG: DUF1289 domain-containing protein [Pseudomonadales bacterium]|nr:DUF1289 domain-containing protein [Pseudomonadales bacterium]MBO6565536.1 DUF1289 domain-containing protein [Pseudomonadales bacterium]MBO6594625.1 DUF1289 domain-containing protein [Pseudomonadales bacterium]MBO6655447.1 DUF1289 domain-containing protein [Pseudomonadales bacterium]MBO6821815.1 DUF1289 domain-containing protein [Pseudomonadales bacterium]
MKRNTNPCIDVCQFSGSRGWCRGCGRTKDESQRWKKMKPFERNEIHRELKKRLVIMSSHKTN